MSHFFLAYQLRRPPLSYVKIPAPGGMKLNNEKQRMVDIRVESCHLPNPAQVAWHQASAHHKYPQYRAKSISPASSAPSTPVKKERKFTLPLRQLSSAPATPTPTVAGSTTSGTIVIETDSVGDSDHSLSTRHRASSVPKKGAKVPVKKASTTKATKDRATKEARQSAQKDSSESDQSVQEYENPEGSEEESDSEEDTKKSAPSKATKRKREQAAAEEETEEKPRARRRRSRR
jgi:hypothetical protein